MQFWDTRGRFDLIPVLDFGKPQLWTLYFNHLPNEKFKLIATWENPGQRSCSKMPPLMRVCEYEHVRDIPAFKLHGLPDWITSRAILYIHFRGTVRYKA